MNKFKTGDFLIDAGRKYWTFHFVYNHDDEYLYLTRLFNTNGNGQNIFDNTTDFLLHYNKLLPILGEKRRDHPIHIFEQELIHESSRTISFVRTLEEAYQNNPDMLPPNRYQELLNIQDFFVNYRYPKSLTPPQGGL